MHGIVFAELKKYVDTKFGGDTWNKLLMESGLGPKMYLAVQEYPDEEVVAIVTTASKVTGLEPAAILEDFGVFIAPDLLAMYRGAVKPGWKTLDVIEHTEESIHKIVRLRNPGAKPPYLHAVRVSPTEVLVTYTSPRRLCSLAKGIARGMADHFSEKVEISDRTCMLKGDKDCQLSIVQV